MEPYYQDEACTIYHGDCREVLPQLAGKVDLVLTDPPYGIGEAAGKNRSRVQLARPTDYGVAHWDDAPIDQALLDRVRTAGRHAIIFGGNFYALPPSSCWLVWDKDNSGDFADCELAWTNLKRAVRKFRWRWNGMLQEYPSHKETRWHPTQKPLALMRWCLELVPDAAVILDPFMGSGTTLRAAKDLGRRSIGVEIEEGYCELAASRLQQEVLPLRYAEAP